MSGGFNTYVVTLTDGEVVEKYANRMIVEDGVLTIWTESYGARDHVHFALNNVKYWSTK